MKRWVDVHKLVDAAQAKNWDLATFKALLDWEWEGAGLKAPSGRGKGTRKPMSAEARKKISDAAKKRWAAAKKGKA